MMWRGLLLFFFLQGIFGEFLKVAVYTNVQDCSTPHYAHYYFKVGSCVGVDLAVFASVSYSSTNGKVIQYGNSLCSLPDMGFSTVSYGMDAPFGSCFIFPKFGGLEFLSGSAKILSVVDSIDYPSGNSLSSSIYAGSKVYCDSKTSANLGFTSIINNNGCVSKGGKNYTITCDETNEKRTYYSDSQCLNANGEFQNTEITECIYFSTVVTETCHIGPVVSSTSSSISSTISSSSSSSSSISSSTTTITTSSSSTSSSSTSTSTSDSSTSDSSTSDSSTSELSTSELSTSELSTSSSSTTSSSTTSSSTSDSSTSTTDSSTATDSSTIFITAFITSSSSSSSSSSLSSTTSTISPSPSNTTDADELSSGSSLKIPTMIVIMFVFVLTLF